MNEQMRHWTASGARGRRPDSCWSPRLGACASIVALWLGVQQEASADTPASPANEKTVVDAEISPERLLTIGALQLVGMQRTSQAWVREILAREGLFVGARLRWPDDPAVTRARLVLLHSGEFSKVAFRLEPVAKDTQVARVILQLEEQDFGEVAAIYGGSSRWTPGHAGAQLSTRSLAGRALHGTFAGVLGTTPRSFGGHPRRQGALRLGFEAPGAFQGGKLGVYGSIYYADAYEPDAPWETIVSSEEVPAVSYRRFSGVSGISISARPELTVRADIRGELLRGGQRVGPASMLDSDAISYPISHDWHALAAIEAGLIWDDRAQIGSRVSGRLARLDLVWAPPVAQDNYDYFRLRLLLGRDFQLPGHHWLEIRVILAQLYGQAPRFEALYAGDFTSLAPGRELDLIYSTRQAFDWLNTGVDRHGLANFAGRTQVQYVVPLFRRQRSTFFRGGEFFLGLGGFGVRGDLAKRRARAALNLPAVAFGADVDAGFRFNTPWGTAVLSISNVVQRMPL